MTNRASSRTCERGTRCCTVRHVEGSYREPGDNGPTITTGGPTLTVTIERFVIELGTYEQSALCALTMVRNCRVVPGTKIELRSRTGA